MMTVDMSLPIQTKAKSYVVKSRFYDKCVTINADSYTLERGELFFYLDEIIVAFFFDCEFCSELLACDFSIKNKE